MGNFIVIFGHNILRANLTILGVWAFTIVYSHQNSVQDIFHYTNVRPKNILLEYIYG
jgi:hypothetical protein